MKTKITLWMLVAAMLCSALTACGQTATTETVPEETAAAETETETSITSFLPEGLDYGGETYNLLYAQTITGMEENELTYKLDEVNGGDIVAEAVYNRTMLCEEALNIKITADYLLYEELKSTLEENHLAGDTAFEAVCGRLHSLGTAVTNGSLCNLKDIETLDLSHDWWDQTVNESMTIGGKQFITSGDINYYDDYSILTVCFNKAKCDDHGIAYPYEDVRNGTWTLEKLYSLVNDAGIDVNGDGKLDQNDFYGFITDAGFMSSAMLAFGEGLTMEGEAGTRVLNDGESIVNKAMDTAEKFLNNDSFCVKERKLGYEIGDKIFPGGQSLFSTVLVGSIVGYRDSMEDPFGIIPYPRYDESQDAYYGATSQHWASAVAVPSVCHDFEKVGYVLDTLGCFSPDTLTEAVIEKNVQTRSSRDEESVEMLQLIFKSKVFDSALVFDWGIYNIWTGFTNQTTPNIASGLAAQTASINAKIADFMEQINALQ